jgi:hypothetical protein
MRVFLRLLPAAIVLAVAGQTPAAAQDLRIYSATASFDDIKFELNNAIIGRGLTIDFNGQIGKMLERTGADVGSTKPLYKQAEYFTFCSAKLSRAMMEADPSNIAFCPYVVFLFEAADNPGEVFAGFRPPVKAGDERSQEALAAIDTLLDGIVRDATNTK